MIIIRVAAAQDLAFLAQTDIIADLEDSGLGIETHWSYQREDEHRQHIADFIDDTQHGAWIAFDTATKQAIGAIMCRYRNRYDEHDTLFATLDTALFPTDGRFCEVFQLWVNPKYRRRGLATRLKQQLELAARERGIKLIYTHTAAKNQHVINLNQKLGYREIRRGTIWDDVVRVSLIKDIQGT